MAGKVEPQKTQVIVKLENPNTGKKETIGYRIAAIGDFSRQPNDSEIGERKPIELKTPDDLEKKMASMNLGLDIKVKDVASDDPDAVIPVNLKFKSMRDFDPDQIIEAVPELRDMLEMRMLLEKLTASMTKKQFLKELRKLVADEEAINELTSDV